MKPWRRQDSSASADRGGAQTVLQSRTASQMDPPINEMAVPCTCRLIHDSRWILDYTPCLRTYAQGTRTPAFSLSLNGVHTGIPGDRTDVHISLAAVCMVTTTSRERAISKTQCTDVVFFIKGNFILKYREDTKFTSDLCTTSDAHSQTSST